MGNYQSGSLILVIALCSALLPAACKRDRDPERIALPSTSILSMRSDWGVVTSDVLRVRKEPALRSDNTLTYIRKGAIVEIVGKSVHKERIEDRLDFWYQINYEGLRGWSFGAYIEVLESWAEAAAQSEALME